MLKEAKQCVCFYCGKRFSFSEIKGWIEDSNGLTAQCPYCSGRTVIKGVNDLATLLPSILDYWDKEKNKDYSSDNLKVKSNIKIWWKCPNCGNQWYGKVADITKRKSVCLKCKNKI